jgi:zinc protease
VHAAELGRALFIESERMISCLYDPADIEAERKVIVAELLDRQTQPDRWCDDEVIATALDTHPYRYPPIGVRRDMEAMVRDDLYLHYRRFYAPDNATLVIAGDVRASDAIRQAARWCDRLQPTGGGARARHVELAQAGERRTVAARRGGTDCVKIAFRAPSASDPGFVPLLLLDVFLTDPKGISLWKGRAGKESARRAYLGHLLREADLSCEVSGGITPTADPFLYIIGITANAEESCSALEEVTVSALDRVGAVEITETDLERAKSQLQTRICFDAESVSGIAHELGFFN